MMKSNRKKVLTTAVTAMMTMAVCGNLPVANASDTEIYTKGRAGTSQLLLMLDNSGSMQIDKQERNGLGSACDQWSGDQRMTHQYNDNGYKWLPNGYTLRYWPAVSEADARNIPGLYPFQRTACLWDWEDKNKYGNNTDVQEGDKIYEVTYLWDDKWKYYYCPGNKKQLTSAEMKAQCKEITTAAGTDGTMFLNLYVDYDRFKEANTGGYFITKNAILRYDRITRLKMALYDVLRSGHLPSNIQLGIGTFTTNDTIGPYSQIIRDVGPIADDIYSKIYGIKAETNTPIAIAYGDAANYMLSRDNTECGAKGIYFLTDGYPNMGQKIGSLSGVMGRLLTPNTYNFPSNFSVFSEEYSNDVGGNSGDKTAGWPAISKMARILTDKQIRTAVVGFGSEFRGVGSGEYDETTGKTYYNCQNISNNNQKQACYWGSRAYAKYNDSKLGAYGNGGFYYAQSSEDVEKSILEFADSLKSKWTESVVGAPLVPIDPLEPTRILDEAYYSSFIPSDKKMWLGNLNKYTVQNGALVTANGTRLIADNGVPNTAALEQGAWGSGFAGKIQIAKTGTTERKIFTNLGRTGTVFPDEKANRTQENLVAVTVDKVLKLDNSGYGIPKKHLLRMLGYSIKPQPAGNTDTNYPSKVDDLIPLQSADSKEEGIKQYSGAAMHSTPIYITQKYTKSKTGDTRQDYVLFGTHDGLLHLVNQSGQEEFVFAPSELMIPDYLSYDAAVNNESPELYGLDAPWAVYSKYVYDNGSFNVNATAAEKGWVYDNNALRPVTPGDVEDRKGFQWIYGGMRMGGSNYFSLDITDINNPKFKFNIVPSQGAVYSAKKGAKSYAALNYMGQSWSKPTIANILYPKLIGGKTVMAPRTVMIVGGGYDPDYEKKTKEGTWLTENGEKAFNKANFDSTADKDFDLNDVRGSDVYTKGAGVYMFDADTGELIWWTSGHKPVNDTGTDGAEIYTNSWFMDYSVVSQINAVDRDDDGYVDHLYFGDLGGQGWRIDLNNKPTVADKTSMTSAEVTNFKKNFARSVRLFSLNVRTNGRSNCNPQYTGGTVGDNCYGDTSSPNNTSTAGTSARFYEMPSVSVQRDEDGDRFLAVAFASGDRSFPLSGNGSTYKTRSAKDGVYVIYDTDVARKNLFDLTFAPGVSVRSNNYLPDGTKQVASFGTADYSQTDPKVNLSLFDVPFNQDNKLNGKLNVGIPVRNHKGWYYEFSDVAGRYKGVNGLYALDNLLFTNVYDKGADQGVSCTGGLRGETSVYQFCMPTGKCDGNFAQGTGENAKPISTPIGKGIVGVALGNRDENGNFIGLVSGAKSNICTEQPNSPMCHRYNTNTTARILRWYEARSGYNN